MFEEFEWKNNFCKYICSQGGGIFDHHKEQLVKIIIVPRGAILQGDTLPALSGKASNIQDLLSALSLSLRQSPCSSRAFGSRVNQEPPLNILFPDLPARTRCRAAGWLHLEQEQVQQ